MIFVQDQALMTAARTFSQLLRRPRASKCLKYNRKPPPRFYQFLRSSRKKAFSWSFLEASLSSHFVPGLTFPQQTKGLLVNHLLQGLFWFLPLQLGSLVRTPPTVVNGAPWALEGIFPLWCHTLWWQPKLLDSKRRIIPRTSLHQLCPNKRKVERCRPSCIWVPT